jgi:hypothetical protein
MMSNGKDEKDNPKRRVGREDFLAGHGMDPIQQKAAEMNAAAVPVSDFEGEYESSGSSNSPAAQLLQRVMWESRMRKSTGIPKVSDMPEDDEL